MDRLTPGVSGHTAGLAILDEEWSSDTFSTPAWWDGVADGAGILRSFLLKNHRAEEIRWPASIDPDVPSEGTCRFVLSTAHRPSLANLQTRPNWLGSAIVVGDNAYADAIQTRLVAEGVRVYHFRSPGIADVDGLLDNVWSLDETPHLFLTTPHDAEAMTALDANQWTIRREAAVSVPFRICQRWMHRMIDRGSMDGASFIALSCAGNSFGLEPEAVLSPESGAVAGLTKAMMIEAWMGGHRATTMRVLQPALGVPPTSWMNDMMSEIAVGSHDQEVLLGNGRRDSVRAFYSPIGVNTTAKSQVTRGGVWLVSGGARGITALVALTMAEKYDLKLVLLGTAPVPAIDDATRELGIANRSGLRRECMKRAQADKRNPLEAWRNMEKAIEIDATLAEAKRRNVTVMYRCVDVSDVVAVNGVVAKVKEQWGQIRGVLHGAGSGQDARFDRKRADKVDQCIGSKVDGCIAIYHATRDDPLEWFIGFGSISGRFGANGHTDYSLANAMLAQCVTRIRMERPEVRAVTFDWHAWGDIGMAAKPEAKLALEMIGMNFMPASEGLAHFLRELEHGGNDAEVLITDRSYVRKFYPDVALEEQDRCWTPMLRKTPKMKNDGEQSAAHVMTLDPIGDRFLAEHRVGGKPTLPMVMAIEIMCEAAKTHRDAKVVVRCENVVVHQAIKFSTPDPMAIEIVTIGDEPRESSNRWAIKADVRRHDGRLVQEGKIYFESTVLTQHEVPPSIQLARPYDDATIFHPLTYPDETSLVYHGASMRMLRGISINGSEAVGRIATPSPVELGGESRPLIGWVFPVAVFDAVLYAAGALAYQTFNQPSLPVSFDAIDIGRIPMPGESLWVHIRIRKNDAKGVIIDADLGGLNDDRILSIAGYRLNWFQK